MLENYPFKTQWLLRICTYNLQTEVVCDGALCGLANRGSINLPQNLGATSKFEVPGA